MGKQEKEKTVPDGGEQTMEEAFGRLNDILGELDNGGQSLEKAFALYTEGMKMVRLCNDKIDKVEKQCRILDENGESHEF